MEVLAAESGSLAQHWAFEIVCMKVKQRYPADPNVRHYCNLRGQWMKMAGLSFARAMAARSMGLSWTDWTFHSLSALEEALTL